MPSPPPPPPQQAGTDAEEDEEKEQHQRRQEPQAHTGRPRRTPTTTTSNTMTSPSRPTLKRNRPGSMTDLQESQDHRDEAPTSTTTTTTHHLPHSNPSHLSLPTPTPIPIPFRPLSTSHNPLIPLSTPPELNPQQAHLARAREAAHTPRSPPRDLTGVLLGRGVSPSPEGAPGFGRAAAGAGAGALGEKGPGLKGQGKGKGKRRRMMTRTESLGDLDGKPNDPSASASASASTSTSTFLALGSTGKRPFGRVISDSWDLVSPDRNQFTELPIVEDPTVGQAREEDEVEVDGVPARVTNRIARPPSTPPGRLNRTWSVPSPSNSNNNNNNKTKPQTPSPAASPSSRTRPVGVGVAGLGRTTSLPSSPTKSGLGSGLGKQSTTGGGFTFGPTGGSGGQAGQATRTIRTYGKRQEGGAGIVGGGGSSVLSSTGVPGTSTTPAPPNHLDTEINGFLLSSPEKPDLDLLLRPLRGRAVPVQSDSYAELNRRFGVDVEDEDEFDPDSQGSLGDMKAPPSLADLRSKGENRRFMDELGYLRDGLRDQSLPARRSSAIDILSKCTDTAWFDKLRICGQIELLYEDYAAARQDVSDECLDLVLLLYLAHISHNANDLEAVVTGQAETICVFLLGVIRERRLGFPVGATARRKKTSSLDALREIRKSLKPVGLTDISRSPLAMASGILSLVLPNVLDTRGEPHTSLSEHDITVALASAIQQELSELPTRIDLYVKGLDLFPPDHQCDFLLIIDALALLQGIIAGDTDCKTVLQDSYASIAPLFADLLLVLSYDVKAVALPMDHAQELVTLSLKMLLTLTQQSPSWSAAFLQGISPYMGLLRLMLDHATGRARGNRQPSPAASDDTFTSDQEDPQRDDGEVLNLALGCLFNIVQQASDNGASVLKLTIGDPCQGHRTCLKQCRCAGGVSALIHLASIFVDQQRRKADDPSAAFLSGYLALLFSKLLEAKPEAVAQLLKVLPGNNKRDQIQLLIANVIEFRNTYESFQQQLTKGLRRQLEADADMEIVVDDENSSNMIEHALKVYGGMT